MEFWFQLAGSILLTSGIAGYLIKKYLNHEFDKSLESYKNKLNIFTESKKNEYQKDYANFTLYVTKKHEVYIKLYDSIDLSYSHLMDITHPAQFYPDLHLLTEDDFKNYLDYYSINNYTKQQLTALWKTQDSQNFSKIIQEINKWRGFKADAQLNEFKKVYGQSRIYLTDEISTSLLNYIDLAVKLYANFSIEINILPNQKEQFQENINLYVVKLKESLDNIVILLKKELSTIEN